MQNIHGLKMCVAHPSQSTLSNKFHGSSGTYYIKIGSSFFVMCVDNCEVLLHH